MDDKHRCKYPGCNSILHRGHEGEYCYIHEKREYELEQTPDSSVKGDVAVKEELYTVKDLTEILKYSDRSIRGMLNEGEIKGLRIGDRGKWMVPKSEIDLTPKNESSFHVRLANKKKGVTDGQEGIQTRANHQQAA